MKGLMLAVVAGSAVFPATAAADNTPAGPATVMNQWLGVSTLEGRPPEVLVAARVGVGPGGQACTIRIRAAYDSVNALGDPVQLPAGPGTYQFPAPHIRWDYRSGRLGFDQVTGDHAVVIQDVCKPELGRWADPCELQRVDLFTPPGGEGTPTQAIPGARLTVVGVFEPDVDQDLVGDTSEDRTDLKLTAAEPTRTAEGKLRVALTITNAGPRAADLPRLLLPVEGVALEGGCKPSFWVSPLQCGLGQALAAGDARTVTLTADSTGPVATSVRVVSEGPDLADDDNTAQIRASAATPLTATASKSQRLRKGVTVQVLGIEDGRARVTAAFRRGGKTVKVAKVVTLEAGRQRTVTLKATGAKLRSLRRLAGTRTLQASVTVRTLDGKHRVSTATTVRP